MASQQRKRRFGAALIIAAVAGFVALVFAMLARVEPIEVVSSRLGRVGNAVFVEGLVRNTGGDLGSIDLEVHYYDSHGRQLAVDKVALARLPHGGERRFRGPDRELSDVRDFTIYIERGRNPYGN